MSKKPSFSGNIELLKSITEIEQSTYNLKEGSNIELEHDANTSTTTINVVSTPNFDDLVVNSVNVLNELNKKYNVVNDVSFADNEINLNLGTINGVQVPIKQDQVANKKYVDEILDNFWEQIQSMNFVNFKGRYNDRLTYGTGDLVAFFENNNWFFYLSIIDLNNEPLTSSKGWIKISTPVPTNLVTVDVLNAEVEKLNNRIDELEKEVDGLKNKSSSDDYLIFTLGLGFGTLEHNVYDSKGRLITKEINDNFTLDEIYGYIDNKSTFKQTRNTYKIGTQIVFNTPSQYITGFNSISISIYGLKYNGFTYNGAGTLFLMFYNSHNKDCRAHLYLRKL